MDSWTLQGDSYSFLRSTPRTFSLCHRDGTPNHVEIFDIINVPTQRNAISETTCLCDIFGDDCESPSVSSSPASGPVPSHRQADGRAAASPLVDDLNDSSGSYHTAQGSSEGEEVFEDSRERLYSPLLQRKDSESEGEGLSSGHPGVCKDISPKLEQKNKSPVSQLSVAIPSTEVFNSHCSERSPSPAQNNPNTPCPEERVSSLSSSSVESSVPSPNPRQNHSAESRSVTPTPRNKHNSPSHQSSTQSVSPEPKNCVSSSSCESLNTHSLPESREAQALPEQKSISPGPITEVFSLDSTLSNFEPRVILSSHSPSSSSTELSSQARKTPASPELNNRSSSPDIQASSPFAELRGRISVPDLFSRCSTPDIEVPSHTPDLNLCSSTEERGTPTTPENHGRTLSAEPGSAVSTPSPRYTPPSPVISSASTPELGERSVSPYFRYTAPSPGQLSIASLSETQRRTPSPGLSPKIKHISPFSETRSQHSSPVINYNLSSSPEVGNNYSPVQPQHTAPSPEIRITASSPEVNRREQACEVELTSDSLDPCLDSGSSHSSSLTSSPHITAICYSVVQPEDRDTNPFPELSRLFTTEPERTRVSPEARSPTPSRDSTRSSIAESTGTPRDSPHITGFAHSVLQAENTERSPSPQHRNQTPSPEPKHTPSPEPRFTPVHIIAPEKPYRQWQNRCHSPPQVVASSQSSNVKKLVTNTESPNAAPRDNNSQTQWAKLGRQLEMEMEMQLEEEKELGRERQMVREMERERKREERVPEKGEGWQGDASYRGEQVELSFSTRNRKGPASRSTAPTSREPRQGMPTAHSYSESLLATKQLQQQQSLARAQISQQDSRGGGPGRQLQPPAPQNKNSSPGRVATNRPGRSSSSSMGSELDEADNEVKWFTDVAFRSLSSPEVDYLDMYNSSHHSSTNASQPSTQESPAGVSAAWLAYADFRGSAPKLDSDEFAFQHPSTCYSDGLDPSKRYEMGSFECVDVAVEREDSRRRRGVPKRQIQLKRKNNAEMKQDESSENSSPGIPMIMDSPSLERHSRETLVRQHSTPATLQEPCRPETSPEFYEKGERKSKFQKSASLDETKTQMATCLIKSVLSKKMQSVDKQTEDQVGEEASTTSEEKTSPPESAVAPLKDSPKTDTPNLNSTLHSECSFSSEVHTVREEPGTKKGFGETFINMPNISSHSRSDESDFQCRNAASLRPEMRSQLKVPFDSKQSTSEKVLSRTGIKGADDSKPWEESEGGDSANSTDRNTGAPFSTGGRSMQTRVANRDQECENTKDHKQLQQGDKSILMSKTQEINLKATSAMEKKKTSLNVALTSEVENKSALRHDAASPEMSVRERIQRIESRVEEKAEEEGNGNNKVKVPIHKVRDVRRLIKNTYNLSFKATSAKMSSDENEGMTDSNEERREDIKEEEREVRHEMRREEMAEEKREVKEKEVKVERKDEQKEDGKLVRLSPLPHCKGKPLSRSQPMQIECKAVCWKEDKNKVTPSKIDPEKSGDKCQASLQLKETSKEQKNSSSANTQNYTTEDAAISKICQPDPSEEAETQEPTTEAPDNEDKPVVFRRDGKPPMLGSLPKLPSKEREVSTALVVLREGSSKTKTPASPAQEELPNLFQAPATSPSPGPITPASTPGSSGHSVSMLLKEKGYQADIGAVVGDGQSAAEGKNVPRKHVNCLEIPLQTTPPSEGGQTESHLERMFSSSTKSGPNTDTQTKTTEEEVSIKPIFKDTEKQKSASPPRNMQQQTPPLTKQKEQGDFEAIKRQDPTFPPRSPAIRRFRPQPIEVKSLSKETQKQETPTNNTGNSRPQTIEVKSIAKNSQKPVVPPKPNYKFKPSDVGAMPNEMQRSTETTSSIKPQSEEKTQTIVVSSPTIYRKISNESTLTSNYTRKLAVSAVSSCRPPPGKTTATTTGVSNQTAAPSETEVSNDRGQQQQPIASTQSSRYIQRPTTLTTAPASDTGPAPISDLTANKIPRPSSAEPSQTSHPAVVDLNSQPQYPRMAYPHDQTMPVISNNTKQLVSTTQVPGYTLVHQPFRRSLSTERSQRTDDLRFYASDDPPSYDERESFSPLMLPDLTRRRSNRYQPSSRPPPCSCTSSCPSHPGLIHPHHHHSPHSLTPPAPSHSPSQTMSYPVAQPPLRPHQCRPDLQPMSYQPGSSKSSTLGPTQPPAMYQPLHQPPACPPHPSVMQACPPDRPLLPPQHIDPRRPPVHHSPQQQQPPGMAGGPYSDTGHGHSPGLPHMDPQYLCGPQSLGPSYGSEYGGDTSSLYSESNYGQTPRRVLMDPETGKYFYIEVPMQPLRKMLFDPETGQYVEVLIPQQAMSHSGLYPPSAAPYPPLHNPNMYAPAQQYMPYAAPPPPPPPHPQAQPQPPRYPETSASAAMHPNMARISYGVPSGQGSKPEPQNHPPMDQSYLESMYYVPTGMNASPNTTPPDYYHKHPPGLPPTGGKRS
ncbi:hypothetical protein LDENG_00012950 [Lucifuga dentata]|nr:hypothetical protein LDENG_00012950 [Lucifuga dentata]